MELIGLEKRCAEVKLAVVEVASTVVAITFIVSFAIYEIVKILGFFF
jgi:hypothetical protein